MAVNVDQARGDDVVGDPCDPYQQDCPPDYKCSVHIIDNNFEDTEFLCIRKLPGDLPADASCSLEFWDGEYLRDDCGDGLYCTDYDPLPGAGVCRPFCTADEPPCEGGDICHLNYFKAPICRTPCDPQQDECPMQFDYCMEVDVNLGICAKIPAP